MNWLTIVSILLSGLISLIVSAYYYHKGNRSNLQMTILYPVLRILHSSNSEENYNKLCELSQNFCARYLTKKERRSLAKLISAYEKIKDYDRCSVNADSLCEYFEETLQKNGIEVRVCPIYDDNNELVYYNYPDDFFYMRYALEEILKQYYFEFEDEECENSIIFIFSSECKRVYGYKEKIDYFKDHNLKYIFDNSKDQKKWNKKFDRYKEAKDEFMSLKIVKELSN